MGSVGLTDQGGRVAQLRWFLVEPEVRGVGLGRQLLTGALAQARAMMHPGTDRTRDAARS